MQLDILCLTTEMPISDEQDRILTTVFKRSIELKAKYRLVRVFSNAELARKYGISPRTVTNWRREGCPFDKGKGKVLDWIAERRYAPAGTKAKFGEQLTSGRRGFIHVQLWKIRNIALTQRALHLQAGVPLPDWLRGMPFRQR